MSRELVFLPEVSRDFIEAFNYYEGLSPGRGGARFEGAFKQGLAEIQAGVITHLRAVEHFHRVLLPRFPYTLYYHLSGERAIIVGVLYSRFHPRKIEATLKRRV